MLKIPYGGKGGKNEISIASGKESSSVKSVGGEGAGVIIFMHLTISFRS